MKKLFFLAALLCASVMAFATAEDTWLEGNANYANQFKWFAIDGVTAPQEVVNIQSKDANDVIYVNVGQADFDRTTGIIGCEAITDAGAGVWIKISSLTKKNNEIYFKNAGGTTLRGLMIYNELGKEVWEIYDTNFALASNGASATASSGNAAMAIDGNTGTRWESQTKPEQTSEEPKEAIPENIAWNNDQWWMVDMGQLRIYNTIQIRWEGAYGKTFDLEASKDGENWKTVKQINNQSLADFPYEQTLELAANDTARYIRFTGIARGTGYGYSFWEFRVLLPNVSVLTSIGLTAANAIAPVGGAGVALTVSPKDQNSFAMEAEILYEITPADAGNVVNGKYIPAKIGSASIVAYNGEVRSAAVTVFGYEGDNLALSTNISTDNKIVAQSEFAPNGTNAFYAVDTDEGSVWQGSATNGTADTNEARTFDSWFVVDLGGKYTIDLITIKFEGACSQLYHIDFSEDNTAWVEGYNYVGTAGVNGHTDIITSDLDNNQEVRYIRFWSTKAATQWGMKIYSFKVFGREYVPSGDTEAPVMTSATLDSKTWNSAVIAVAATDNDEVAKYHVVNADPAIDVKLVATDGKITVTGLTAETAYNFTITAIDAAQNESENSKSVAVTTNIHLTAPTAAATAPTWPAAQVKAIYSPTYEADWAFANWSNQASCTQETYGKKIAVGAPGYFGVDGFNLNCINMETLHYDIWVADNATLRIVPICRKTDNSGNETEYGETVNLIGQQWNTIDLNLNEGQFANVTNWTNVYQVKIDNAADLTIWVANAYFYRTTELPDAEAPTNVSADASESYFSVVLTVSAEDNSGEVIYSVKLGDDEVATGGGASGATAYITVANLQPNTDYNFSVIAKDAKGNAADPVAVAAKTLVAPAPADAPTYTADKVIAIYSDIYTDLPYNIENWYAGPAIAEGALTVSSNALCIEPNSTVNSCFGIAFAATDITGYDALEMDIYATAANASFGLQVIGVGDASTLINLTAGEWNHIVLDINGNTKTDCTQIGFYNCNNLKGTCFVQNVLFVKKTTTAIDNTVEAVKVQKMIENGQLIIIKNGIRYNVTGQMVQ